MQAVYILEEVELPSNVTAEVKDMKVKIKGPKGEIERDFSHAKGLLIYLKDGKIVVEGNFLDRKKKAQLYSIISHIKNMITGVTHGYRYYLKLIYTHFPVTVKVSGDQVEINNLIGEKNVRRAYIYPGVKVQVKGEDIVVEGIDLEKVAQTAANIERAAKISGFDRRVFADGIYIYKKEVIS